MAKNYGLTATTTVVLAHPKNRMMVQPNTITLWYVKRDTEHALFNLPRNTKTHSVTVLVNGLKAKLTSICTDGTARFLRIK